MLLKVKYRRPDFAIRHCSRALYDREPKQFPRPFRARARELLEPLTARTRHRRRDVRKIRRLVAARGGLGCEIARQKVWAVGLEEELARGYAAHQGHEVH